MAAVARTKSCDDRFPLALHSAFHGRDRGHIRDPQPHREPDSRSWRVVVLGVIWLALIYWTFADARRRIADRMLVACATITSFFPFIGTIIYMIVRPPEYLEDVHERDLEIQAAQARLVADRAAHLPVLRPRGREGVPALPQLPAQAQGPVRRTAASRSRPTGRSARTARPIAASTRRPAAASAAHGATRSRRWSRRHRQTCSDARH